MTVSADLQTATGIQRRFFLRIDGLEPQLWQAGQHPEQTEEDPPQVRAAFDDVFAGITGDNVYRNEDFDTPSWGAEDSTGSEIVRAMDGTSQSDVWMGCASSVMHHWNGTAWSKETLPGSSATIHGLHAYNSRSAFACGVSAMGWEWDGVAWLDMSITGGIDYLACWAADPKNVWFVGWQTGSSSNGRIVHWDGSSFTTQLSHSSGGFYGVWGLSATDVYAIGRNGGAPALYHYDGSTWTDQSADLPDQTSAPWDIGGTDSNHIWACGADSGGAAIWRYDGQSWSTAYSAGGSTQLIQMSVADENSVYFVGESQHCVYYDGSTYSLQVTGATGLFGGVYAIQDEGEANWTRSGLNCLRLPEAEWSQEINLGTMESQWSAMRFELDDIPDPDDLDTSYFGKLFAPGRWQSTTANHTHVVRPAFGVEHIPADNATIHVANTYGFSQFAASGTAYIGQETFSYTGTSTVAQTGFTSNETIGKLTGCTRGLYPAYVNPRGGSTTTMGTTFLYPRINDDQEGYAGDYNIVSDVPYFFLGRKVGLYCTTFDEATGLWNNETAAELVWAGKISDSISYDPTKNAWALQCESIFADLDKNIASSLPVGHLQHINMNGQGGRIFRIIETGGVASLSQTNCVAYATIEVTKGWYTPWSLVDEINQRLADTSNWTDVDGTHSASVYVRMSVDGDKCGYSVINAPSTGYTYTLIPIDVDTGYPAHCLQALGWDIDNATILLADTNNTGRVESTSKIYHHYHPTRLNMNGEQLLLKSSPAESVWGAQSGSLYQGDFGATPIGFLKAQNAHPSGQQEKSSYVIAYYDATIGPVSIKYTATSGLSVEHQLLTLPGYSFYPPAYFTNDEENDKGFIGSTDRNAPPELRQIYHPFHLEPTTLKRRGPFRQLVRALLSDGHPSYNEDATYQYDELRKELSVGVPLALVDAFSFELADSWVEADHSDLADRRQLIFDKPISWMKWFNNEARLFGKALVWKQGKLRVVDMFSPELQSASETIDESNSAAPDDFPMIEMSQDMVVNQYVFDIGYNIRTSKYDHLGITVADRESIDGLAMTKEVKIQNPGIMAGIDKSVAIRNVLKQLVRGRIFVLRSPWQRVRRTLSPSMFNRIFAGDIVSFVHDNRHPDPYGSGAYSTTAKAYVLNVSWDLANMKGTCTLLLWSRINANTVPPWAPSALIDHSATNAGWTHASNQMVLSAREFGISTDNHDGEAFAVGDVCIIRERAPANEAAPATGPWQVTVNTAYNTTTNVLTFDPVSLTGFDNAAGTEYYITFDNHEALATNQDLRGLFGGSTSFVLSGDVPTQRWG